MLSQKHSTTKDRTLGTLIILAFAALLLSACQSLSVSGQTVVPDQQLRLANTGGEDIKGLVVLFPGPTADSPARRVEFGDVPAGGTTVYRDVPAGVYRYAAYEYELNGRTVHQAVMDWVGESPMQGQRFTYRIALDTTQVQGNQIQLVEVVVD